jgi:predicted Zn-dependent protease
MHLTGINLRKVVVVLVILGGLGVAGWLARPAVLRWHHSRLLVEARQFQAKKDIRSAVLVVTGILTADPGNVDATRLMADMAENHGARPAVFWRARLAEMEPTDGNLTSLALVSVRFNEITRARAALAKVSPAGQQALPYKRAALAIAVIQNQRVLAEQLMRDVVRLEPPNPANELNLATLQVSLPHTNALAGAVQTLEILRTNPVTRLGALRALYLAREKQGDSARQLAVATELAVEPGATISDQLQQLEMQRRLRRPEFAGGLVKLQRAITNALDVLAVESWMSVRGLARQAEVWLEGLPMELRREHPVPMALAEALVVQENWPLLEELTRTTQWPTHDFLRLAMHARALRAREDYVQSRKAWQAAVATAGGRAFDLRLLARAATAWRWEAEAEGIWWLLASGNDEPRGALEALQRIYSARGETRQLMRVYRRGLETEPDDLLAKNNLAMDMLLLYEDVPAATRLAKEVMEAVPDNPFFVSTYAYALVVNKRAAEARALMEKLPAKTFEVPSLGTYYGIVLAAAGDKVAAARYLALAEKARLLPEEKTLVIEALQKGSK